MEIFSLTLSQMLMMFILMAIGVLLRKNAVLTPNAGNVMARMETYIFVPALNLYNFITKCTVESFTANANLLLYGVVIVAVALFFAYLLGPILVRKKSGDADEEYQRNIYRYAMSFGNFGFMGNFIVLGIWGADVFYQYALFTLPLSILCNSWGLYVLIPKDRSANRWLNIKKGLLTPPIIASVVGIVLGLLGVGRYMPDFLINALNNGGVCQGPVAMVLAGFVVGGYPLLGLLKNGKVYIASLLRLILIPTVVVLAFRMLGASELVQKFTLVAFATPLGLNTIVYPAAYGGDTKTGASMAMISNVLAVITVPIMYLMLFSW